MRRLLTRAVMAGVLVLCGFGVAATATALPAPAVVSLDGVGVIGRFDSAGISGTLKCRADSVEPELVISVYQGERAGTQALSNIVCDGKEHRFSTSLLTNPLGGPFEPGQTWVEARLTVHEPVMHDPLPQGYDANAVWLRPNVKVAVVWPLVLNKNGTMTVTVDAVCRGPWSAESIGVRLNQGTAGLGAYGETYVGYPSVPCDGRTHRLRVVVEPLGETVFKAQRTTVGLAFSIWDEADTGDPINGHTWEGQVKTVRR